MKTWPSVAVVVQNHTFPSIALGSCSSGRWSDSMPLAGKDDAMDEQAPVPVAPVASEGRMTELTWGVLCFILVPVISPNKTHG